MFETYNGGQSWKDISGNLPDVPGDALLIEHQRLALATDLDMYTAQAGQGAQTNGRGSAPACRTPSVNDVTPGPDGLHLRRHPWSRDLAHPVRRRPLGGHRRR